MAKILERVLPFFKALYLKEMLRCYAEDFTNCSNVWSKYHIRVSYLHLIRVLFFLLDFSLGE